MMHKITAFSIRQSENGKEITYKHSTIDTDGKIVSNNDLAVNIPVDDQILMYLNEVEQYVNKKLPVTPDAVNRLKVCVIHTTGEGERMKVEYAIVDNEGTIVKDSESFVIVIMDTNILMRVEWIKEYLLSKIQ